MATKFVIARKSFAVGLVFAIISALICLARFGSDDNYIGVLMALFGVIGFTIGSSIASVVMILKSKHVSSKTSTIFAIAIMAVIIIYYIAAYWLF